MYNVIYAPKGYHGILGRRIQKEIQNDRAHRFQHKVKQFIKKSDNNNKKKPVNVCQWQQSRLLLIFFSKIEVWFLNRWNWLPHLLLSFFLEINAQVNICGAIERSKIGFQSTTKSNIHNIKKSVDIFIKKSVKNEKKKILYVCVPMTCYIRHTRTKVK